MLSSVAAPWRSRRLEFFCSEKSDSGIAIEFRLSRKTGQKIRYVKPTVTPFGFMVLLETPGISGAPGQIWYS